MQALGLYDKEPSKPESEAEIDKAMVSAVNGKFGLIAVGTAGYVNLSYFTYNQRYYQHHHSSKFPSDP